MDDVAVIDVYFPITAHPLHAFHEVALVVHFQMIGIEADLYHLANEPGRDAVAASRHLDRAPPAHLGLVVGVFRHGSWRQGP